MRQVLTMFVLAACVWNAEAQPLSPAVVDTTTAARFARPYGLAWLLQLGLELREWDDDPSARDWSAERTFFHHAQDRGCPLAWEPGGQDFLSPCLAEADLLRRLLDPEAFAGWLTDFLPEIPFDGTTSWLPVAEVTDRTDGKLAHLDGLNLSRAWMLAGIAAGLPAADPRHSALLAAAAVHGEAGLAAVTGEHYAGGHWLGSFATYLTTRRGLE